jgi:hypothetical protein
MQMKTIMSSIGVLKTANASSYLRKLCQHWGHKFAVEFDDHKGTIALPHTNCTLEASTDTLTIRLDVEDGADATRMRQVVEEHLQRFGFREELIFEWNPVTI